MPQVLFGVAALLPTMAGFFFSMAALGRSVAELFFSMVELFSTVVELFFRVAQLFFRVPGFLPALLGGSAQFNPSVRRDLVYRVAVGRAAEGAFGGDGSVFRVAQGGQLFVGEALEHFEQAASAAAAT